MGRSKEETRQELLDSLALGLGSGILLAVPFLRPELSWLHFVALVPWTLLLTRESDHFRGPRFTWRAFLVGALAFMGMSFGPYSALSKWIPLIAGVLFSPMMLPFAVFLRAAHRCLRLPLVVLVPVAWVAGEWVRLRFSVGQMALYPLGSSQYRFVPLIQVADVTGLAGISFVVAATSGALADIWLRRRQGWRRLALPGAALLAMFVAVLAYGQLRLASLGRFQAGPRIAVVQPNEVHYRDPRKARALFDVQAAFTESRIKPGSADLVAWPENAIDYPFSEDPYFARGLATLARRQDAAVLAGAFSWASKAEETLHTSGFYYSREGRQLGRYDKIYLIPFAEYVPFEQWLAPVSQRLHAWYIAAVRHVLGYYAPGIPGDEVELFEIESDSVATRFATPICYEVAHRGFGPRAVAAGADFMVNISSEGFFGAPVYYHMFALSVIRAVESRRSVVRVSNHAFSGFIDPAGRPQSLVRGLETGRPYLEPATLIDRVALFDGTSFYAKRGEVFSYLCLAVSVLLLAGAMVSERRRRASSAPGRSSRP